MKFTQRDKEVIQKIHLLSGLPLDECKEFYKYQVTALILDYMENKSSHIPLIGDLKIEHLGDTYRNRKGREAVLSVEFSSDAFLNRAVGNIEDGEETEIHDSILRRDIRRYFQRFETEDSN